VGIIYPAFLPAAADSAEIELASGIKIPALSEFVRCFLFNGRLKVLFSFPDGK
jgi:hypothetical protein